MKIKITLVLTRRIREMDITVERGAFDRVNALKSKITDGLFNFNDDEANELRGVSEPLVFEFFDEDDTSVGKALPHGTWLFICKVRGYEDGEAVVIYDPVMFVKIMLTIKAEAIDIT